MIMDAFSPSTKFFFLCLLCIIMLNSVICSLKVHCNEKDMNTLLHFKQGVIDPSGLLSSWFSELDCCKWKGVKCDNITSRVIELNLPCHTKHPTVFAFGQIEDKSHCLTGKFSLSLLELEFLSHLDLSNNDFKAIHYNPEASQKCTDMSRVTVPHQCRNSSNLQYLDLSNNYDMLVDNLLWISHLSSLQYLNLGGTIFYKEVEWLQSVTMLPSLLELHLETCLLENIYPSLQYANFTSLQVLNLANNDFVSQLPIWLFNLRSDISHIDISRNQIHGQLPQTLSNLGSIESLVLSQNYLTGPIPDWLVKHEKLQELDLSYNSFSGPIPTSLGNLSSLTILKLSSNDFNGNLPQSLGKLFNLEDLDVANNYLTGSVSERNLLSLSNLKYLSLSSPLLIFDFDPEWVPPFQLLQLRLGYVSDKLPSWLFSQTSLNYLSITDSSASFEPLDKFWNFTSQIEVLHFINNTINGDMSNVWLNSNMVWMESNNLRGGLPRLSPQVTILNLYDNFLSGSISPFLCHNMKENNSLLYLELDNNQLSGELTDCWSEWKSLIYVDFGNNNLTGKIPDSVGSLSNLIALYLNGNKFYGEIPLSMKNCQNLWVLDLSENNFFGAIPRWMGQGIKLLELRSNQFSGNIPTRLCQLHSLRVVDFANNRLSGSIPNCLHNITTMLFHPDYASMPLIYVEIQVTEWITEAIDFGITILIKGNELPSRNVMYVIDLSSNNLSGSVPLEMFMLTALQSLNLSHNQLMGTIPQEIGNLEQLESIDLSRNHFSEQIPESMSSLHYLAVLNLSFNKFVGKIPSGTQLEGFTNLSYMGNQDLCGTPLTKICPQDEKPHNTKPKEEEEDDDDKSEVHSWFYMGLGIGFATGFWGVFGVILFNRRCRHAYFRFLQRIYDFVIQKMSPRSIEI